MKRNAVRLDLRQLWRDLTAERAWLAIGIALVLALFIFVFSWERCFFDGCPDVASLTLYQPGGAPVILDRHGEVFAELTPVAQRIIPLSTLPSHVAEAFLAVEDQRFHEHHGIDLRRVGGAFLANLRSGDIEQGFSTITMQVARNVFPDRIPGQERSLSRKLTEIRVAKEIEQRYSKDEILELYLNHIYFGNRARGIDAAAHQYFGVPPEQLNLAQAALLAALPKAPSHYDPRRHPEEAQERRNLVLDLMEQQGRVHRFKAEEARRAALDIVPPPRQEMTEAGLAPYFVEQVRRELEEKFGDLLYQQESLRVRTTLDSRFQRAAEEELARQLRRIENGELGAFDGPRYWTEAQPSPEGTDYLQGAVVLLDARNGDVLAWVGGRSFAHSQFDRASQARRQAGSAFKPFVYAAALRDGWVLSQPLEDKPLTLRLANGQIWKPRNFTGEYAGEVTVRDALVLSKNVATVRLAGAVGLGEVVDAALRAGIDEPLSPVPAMALGTAAVSPLELTSAYTAFAAGGSAAYPRWLLAIEDSEGRPVWESEPRRREALDPNVAYLITNVLSDALERGTGFRVRQSGVRAPAAGKTGTTNDGADTWFVGYTPEISAGVWVGFDTPRPIVEDATGGRVAAPIWANIIRRVYAGRPLPKPWAVPDGVVSRAVDPGSGLILKEGCAPLTGQPYKELFLKDSQPAPWCPGKEPMPRNAFPAQVRQSEKARRQAAEEAEQLRLVREEQEREREEREQEERDRLALLQKEQEREEQKRLAREKREQQDQQAEVSQERQERLAEQKKDRAREEAAREREERLAQEKKEKQEKETKAATREREERLAEQKAEQKKKDQEEERQARLAAQKAQERRLEEREAELRRAEERLRRNRTEREKDPESDADVKVAQRAERDTEPDDEEAAEEEAEDEEASTDLSGWWEITNRIASTNYKDYVGLRLGYRIKLEQDGNRITGRGQKATEDGRAVSGAARSPIRVSGRIEGNTVTLEFTEQGARRSSSGGFELKLSSDRTSLRGDFWSNVANTKGSTLARRMP